MGNNFISKLIYCKTIIHESFFIHLLKQNLKLYEKQNYYCIIFHNIDFKCTN